MVSVNAPAASRIHRLTDATDGCVAGCVRGPGRRDTVRALWVNLCDASISTASSARKRWYPWSYTLTPAPCHRRSLDEKDTIAAKARTSVNCPRRPPWTAGGALTDPQHGSEVTCPT